MKQYTVYFEIFGKKMKTTIHARNEKEAKEKVLKKIIFYKVEEFNPFNNNPIIEFFNNLKK